MDINQISLANHCLHLCNNLNMEETIYSYLIDADVFVTNNIEEWEKRFHENAIDCPIKKPNDIKQNERIVVDGTSFERDFEKLEMRWRKQERAICIYNIEKIDPEILKELVNAHDKLLLFINKIRMYSNKTLEKEINELAPEIVENLVKRELKNIILSLLLSNPMSGTDLVKILYQKFRVFISPGMLYPTLHELEKKGLLTYDYKLKNKVYTVQRKEHAEDLIKNHVRANSLLSQFLVNK